MTKDDKTKEKTGFTGLETLSGVIMISKEELKNIINEAKFNYAKANDYEIGEYKFINHGRTKEEVQRLNMSAIEHLENYGFQTNKRGYETTEYGQFIKTETKE